MSCPVEEEEKSPFPHMYKNTCLEIESAPENYVSSLEKTLYYDQFKYKQSIALSVSGAL